MGSFLAQPGYFWLLARAVKIKDTSFVWKLLLEASRRLNGHPFTKYLQELFPALEKVPAALAVFDATFGRGIQSFPIPLHQSIFDSHYSDIFLVEDHWV